jgi:glucosamine--fructose-6-phosphate aminotransferase (isomerizing)
MSRMLDEIHQQPAVLERALRDGAGQIEAAVEVIRRAGAEMIVIAARGSSAYAGTYFRSLAETILGVPVLRAAPVVRTTYNRSVAWRRAVMIAISQSGQGPDTLAVVEDAADAGIPVIAIVNDEESPLAAAADVVIPCRAGPEAITATKSYTAELALLAALVAGWARDEELRRGLETVPGAVAAAIESGRKWLEAGAGAELIGALTDCDRATVISRGRNLGTAREVALKITETGGVFTAGLSAADFLHGQVVLATPEVPLLALRPDGPVGASVDRALEGATPYGARQWLIGGREVAGRAGALDLAYELPESLSPLALAVPGQLVAEKTALARGRDPDRPNGLVKVIRTY